MSKLKFSENLFLEVNELQRMVKFLSDDGYKLAIKSLTKSFGIVENEENSFFKVMPKSGSNDTVIINSGIAFTSDIDAIMMENPLNMTVTNTGENRWLVLSRGVKNSESGTVSVNVDGSLSGIGTKFTEVLRGQPNFPTKIKFLDSNLNHNEYEVVSVISDTSAVLSGSFANESGLKYSVIGTFTPGFQPLSENKEIYEYDSYNIRIIDSTAKPSVSSNEFIIAKISFDPVGGMIVSDERIYSMFNNPYINQGGGSSTSYKNTLVSLLSTSVVGGVNTPNSISADLELIFEHGYTINGYELSKTSSSNTFNITSGNSNFLGNGDIPNSIFKDWVLVNRSNMKFAKIKDNVNKSLQIPIFDSELFLNSGNDFIVVPDFSQIEYEIKVSSNLNFPSKPFYFKNSAWNLFTRARIYLLFPSVSESFEDEVTISVKYRMLGNNGKQFPFSNLAISQFYNIEGNIETLSESSFVINLAEIEPKEQRNYS